MKFTAKTVDALQLPAGKVDHIFWDDHLSGLGLRIREGGSRNWVFQYALGKKQRRMSLGSAIAIPLADARKTAVELHAKVKLGQDPAGQKEENKQQAAETFEAVARVYLAARKLEMRPGAYDQIDRHLLKYCKPLHGLQLATVTQRTIATRINELKESSGAVQANRTRSSLLAFYGWAMQQGIVIQNPVANTGRFSERPRERVLTDDELREVWESAGDDHYGSIVKLLLLLGQRAGEIADLRRSEIGKVEVPAVKKSHISGIELPAFMADVIDLPPERMKAKKRHIVPLSRPALAILDRQPVRVDDDGKVRDLVFGIGQRGFSGWSKSKERLDERIHAARVKAWEAGGRKGEKPAPMAPWVVHDLRRSLDTAMNERLGIAPHVVAAVLAHTSGHASGKVGAERHYNHSLYMRERVEALRLWADHIMALVGENVVPMMRQAAE